MSPTRTSPPKPQKRPEGFRTDGSWGIGFDGGLTAFVWRMCRSRRQTASSPAEIARAVRTAGFEWAFPNLGEWEGETRSSDLAWLFLTCSHSTEQTVRVGGYGEQGDLLPDGRAVRRSSIIRRAMTPLELQQIRLAERWVSEAFTPESVQRRMKHEEEVPPPPEMAANAEV